MFVSKSQVHLSPEFDSFEAILGSWVMSPRVKERSPPHGS
ncbi:hypothetical protein LG52_142 [Geobacillus kaustophilus]|uniref:Uncharacterized protein n=1 Tax=Geobacillus kaustophilus TaxID=1462 RepID=A0A0D8BT41_GEOKU|nr:hypothetical protein LG52_142 [Geobacillus kaustophilus]